MIKIEINDQYYLMPQSFAELSLGVYQKLAIKLNEIETKQVSTEYENNTREIDKLVSIVSSLTGIEETLLKDIDIKQFNTLCEKATFIFDTEAQKQLELKYIIEIGGTEYGFDTLLDMNTAEFIDLEELTKDPLKINENLHLIMAILYRPLKIIKKENWFRWAARIFWAWVKLQKKFPERIISYELEKYDGKQVLERAEVFRNNLNMDKIFTPLFFFTSLKLITMKNTVASLNDPILIKMMDNLGKLIQKKSLKKSGDGS